MTASTPDTLAEGMFVRTAGRPFGAYVHVPYCRVRCGYCDFNTYTAEELGGGASQESYADTVIEEIRLAARRWSEPPQIETVFFGGGTPTILPAADLNHVLASLDEEFGLAPGAEITTEANPDSVTPESLSELREGGFNRISFGVQSVVPHVLEVLDRTHDPERVPAVVDWARAAGFDQLSVDLIYGSPGESMADWERSLRAASALEPDHISAYALIVEEGTALARQVRRGEVVLPDDDETADKYVLADELLSAAGLAWYELSNWARNDEARCRHNELYWTGGDWWGFGPGAHSHHAGTRWWNVKHPRAYAARLDAGELPVADRELLDAAARGLERVLLEIRLREGLPLRAVDPMGRAKVDDLIERGLITTTAGRLVLTLRGRLLADAVVRELTP